ncbi:hypothetical protein [Agrobacterium vitis]|uniref:hypothetical protein n=1 Tax=Agrobacterium vitis TaxID=373 RepID=UPI000873215A|nr:hypothetical protein [Agrobacterium vitis]MUO72928.1 hypothetical protein [Agrobacterium vitis]
MQRAVDEISRSEPPVAIWMALPAPYSMNIAGSLAHPAIKKLFELWGNRDEEVSWRGYTFTVDSGDLSVSTEFSNGDKDWCSLSLTGDGLALSITSNGEQSLLTVPADRLDQPELFEDWFPHIQLH